MPPRHHERCANCEWWERGRPAFASWETLPGEPEQFLGVCTIDPPRLVGDTTRTVRAMFPQTHESRRCGAWEEREADDPNDGERAPTGFVVNLADHRGKAA